MAGGAAAPLRTGTDAVRPASGPSVGRPARLVHQRMPRDDSQETGATGREPWGGPGSGVMCPRGTAAEEGTSGRRRGAHRLRRPAGWLTVGCMSRHRSPPRRAPWIVGGAAVLVAGGLGIWGLTASDGGSPRPTPSVSSALSLPTLDPLPSLTAEPETSSTARPSPTETPAAPSTATAGHPTRPSGQGTALPHPSPRGLRPCR